MIISFASSKGGVGKSTTCAAVAAKLAASGATVYVLDIDQSRALTRWGKKIAIPGLTVTAVERDAFTSFFRDLMAGTQADTVRPNHVLIDLPGVRETTVLKAIARADLVVIPSQASELDLYDALRVVGDIRDVAEETGRAVPYRLLLTKVFPLRMRVTDYAYAELARLGLPLFRTALVERSAYREMFLTGRPPTDAEPGRGAGLEVENLVDELRAIVAAGQGAAEQGAQAQEVAA